MLGDEKLGYFLLMIHILSSVLVGIIFRFYGHETNKTTTDFIPSFTPPTSIGEVLGSSINKSMEVMMQIGGYIIIFSVIGALIKETALVKMLGTILYYVLRPLGISRPLALSWIIGIVEMSNGTHMVSAVEALQGLKLAVISFILGWGGLSVHAQSLHFMKNIRIKTHIYLFSKLFHGTLAFILTLLLFPIYLQHAEQSVPVFARSSLKYFPVISISFILMTLAFSVFAIKVKAK